MQLDNHFYFLLPMSFGVQQERTLEISALDDDDDDDDNDDDDDDDDELFLCYR